MRISHVHVLTHGQKAELQAETAQHMAKSLVKSMDVQVKGLMMMIPDEANDRETKLLLSAIAMQVFACVCAYIVVGVYHTHSRAVE